MFAFICISHKCNQSCKYCYYQTELIKKTDDSISKDVFINIVCWLARVGFKGVSITGGEPTLHPEIINFIKVLNNVGIATNLITNGTTLSESFCKLLKDSGLDSITISIDSLKPLQHNKCRGLFVNTLDGYLNAVSSKINNIEISMCVHKYNDKDILNTISFFKSRGHEVIVNFPGSTNAKERSWEIKNPLPTINQLLTQSCLNEVDNIFLNSFKAFYENGTLEGTCKMGRKAFFIDSDGEFLPCPFRKDLKLDGYLKFSKDDFLKAIHTDYSHIKNQCLDRKCLNLFINKFIN